MPLMLCHSRALRTSTLLDWSSTATKNKVPLQSKYCFLGPRVSKQQSFPCCEYNDLGMLVFVFQHRSRHTPHQVASAAS